jgi:mono/diheme cytochrome c family protein
MDFARRTQTSLRTVPWIRAAALVVALAAVTSISGCTKETAVHKTAVVSEPTLDQRMVAEDFGFPSRPPSLKRGKEIFQQTCSRCHAQGYWQTQKVKEDLAYTTPIDLYLMLSTGQAPAVTMPTDQRHQLLGMAHAVHGRGPMITFRDLSRDDRWATIFYARYLAGAGDIAGPNPAKPDLTVDSIFGGNCAVCHGKRGQADGPLHVGKTGNHELHNSEIPHDLLPAPANFTQYDRLYNRTDAQLFRYICQGIYPSAMPSWYGDVSRDRILAPSIMCSTTS